MTTAMLKQLMRIARTPPSPKKSAWMMSATLTAMTAAHGPRMIAMGGADAVRRRPARDRHVEHHDRERERREDRQERDRPVVQDGLHALGRESPGGHGEQAGTHRHDRA